MDIAGNSSCLTSTRGRVKCKGSSPASTALQSGRQPTWCNGTLYLCGLSCPLMMALPFQSMTAALMKNVCWPLSAKALMAFTAAGPPLSWRTATLLHQSWPLLVQENEPWKQRITCDELSNIQKASNFERFQGSFMRLVVRCSDTFLSNFRMSAAKGAWTRFCL